MKDEKHSKRNSLERPYNSNTWTTARYNSFIKSALRSASQRWPPRWDVLNEAKQGKKINRSTGRLAEHYKCNLCKGSFPAKEIEVNHIVPVVPVEGFSTWDEVIKRMYCEKPGLEVVCKPCHKNITKGENEQRKLSNPE